MYVRDKGEADLCKVDWRDFRSDGSCRECRSYTVRTYVVIQFNRHPSDSKDDMGGVWSFCTCVCVRVVL